METASQFTLRHSVHFINNRTCPWCLFVNVKEYVVIDSQIWFWEKSLYFLDKVFCLSGC